MDESRFDCMARSLVTHSRRGMLSALTGVIGVATLDLSAGKARKHKKRRKRKHRNKGTRSTTLTPLLFNEFGCVDVGKPCRGDGANCCSGICQGTAPANGQPDSSICVGHHVGDCPGGKDNCTPAEVPCGDKTFCYQTTGKGQICGWPQLAQCRACDRDADCHDEFGSGAACIVCATDCPETQNRKCMPPLY